MARRKQASRVAAPEPSQIIMPGVQPVTLGERLQFQAGLPMQPRRAQKPLDIGFWDPMRDQLDIFYGWVGIERLIHKRGAYPE
jgi:hypothetical protein